MEGKKITTIDEAVELIVDKVYPRALIFVPEEMRTTELFLALFLAMIEQDRGYLLDYIPRDFKTAEFYLKAVREDCFALEYVPEELKTAVTAAEFARFVETTGYVTLAEREDSGYIYTKGKFIKTKGVTWKNPHFPKGWKQEDDYPVVVVSTV